MNLYKKNIRIFFVVIITLVSVFIPAKSRSDKIYIDIDSPMIQKFPIAIVDFRNIGQSGSRDLSSFFSAELARVLQLTGYFNVLDKRSFLENVNTSGITADNTHFGAWTAIGAESLVKGGYSIGPESLRCEFRLFDCISGRLLVGREYTGKITDCNDMVYKFAGEILLAMTGEKGIFDTKIAFAGKKGKSSEIYTINFDGTGLAKITNHNSLAIRPQWAPNGSELYFTSYRDENPDLYVMSFPAGKERPVFRFRGLNMAGPWSQGGRYMLLTLSKDGNPEIYRMDGHSRELKRLTQDSASDISPCWSPDGSRIAFVSDRGGSPQIYVMDSDGGNVKRLTYEGNYNTSPAWSPKNRKIAYESRRNGSFQIFIMDENGGNSVQATFDGWNESPCWSPDGRYLVFSNKGEQKSQLCIVNSNGSNLRVLHEGMDGYNYTSWSPSLNLY